MHWITDNGWLIPEIRKHRRWAYNHTVFYLSAISGPQHKEMEPNRAWKTHYAEETKIRAWGDQGTQNLQSRVPKGRGYAEK